MVISQTQCFLIVLLLGAVVGLRRGWEKEVLTCAIVLGVVLFLSNGGGSFLSNFFTHGPNGVTSTASAQAASGSSSSALCSTTGNGAATGFLATLFFGGMTLLGYLAGNKYGAVPKSHTHRLTGMIPGAANGGAVAYYVSNSVLPGQQFTLFSPSGGLTSAYLPLILGFAFLLVLVLVLIASTASKSK